MWENEALDHNEPTDAMPAADAGGTIRLGAGIGLADLAVESSDCGHYLMLMCGESLVALVGATGSDVEAVEFADGMRYRVEDLLDMVAA